MFPVRDTYYMEHMFAKSSPLQISVCGNLTWAPYIPDITLVSHSPTHNRRLLIHMIGSAWLLVVKNMSVFAVGNYISFPVWHS